MPLFEYKAINDIGKTITGTMEASFASAVSEYLDSQNFVPIKITEKKKTSFNINLINTKKKVKVEEQINFTKQLVTLLKAGVPIISSLESLIEQTGNQTFSEVLTQVYHDVEGGSSFSDSLKKHPAIFGELYVNSVRAGETGGVLDQVLERLGMLMSYEQEMKAKIKGATRYPIIVICGITIGFAVLMTVVVPKFVDLFASTGARLPLPTKILMGISEVFKGYWWAMLIGAVGIVVFSINYVKTTKGRYNWDKIKLKIPVFGNLFLKTAMSRFAHMFETLNKSGLPILQTMEIVSKTIGNVIIAEALDQVGQGIEKGKGIAKPLQESKLFPPLVVRMLAVGEQSGSLDEMLRNVSEHYDTEVNYLIQNLVTMIEPILTVTIGAIILLLALGIFLPMWEMMNAVGG